jgi:hypothetical protein
LWGVRPETTPTAPSVDGTGQSLEHAEDDMVITLNEDEAELLRQTVREAMEDLRHEIHHTHQLDVKEHLKHKKATFYRLLTALGESR